MKAILISIKPKYVAKILNGEKILEIRKSIPKCELPVTVYIYCTKDLNRCLIATYPIAGSSQIEWKAETNYFKPFSINGKVMAKFTLNKVEETFFEKAQYEEQLERICKDACLTEEELWDYAKNNKFYAWHIDNLEIFKKPRYLNEGFFQPKKSPDQIFIQTYLKGPQSWCYVLYRKGFNNEQIRRK